MINHGVEIGFQPAHLRGTGRLASQHIKIVGGMAQRGFGGKRGKALVQSPIARDNRGQARQNPLRLLLACLGLAIKVERTSRHAQCSHRRLAGVRGGCQ